MFENVCSDIIQTMKCFALEIFNISFQVEHTKIKRRIPVCQRCLLFVGVTVHESHRGIETKHSPIEAKYYLRPVEAKYNPQPIEAIYSPVR